MMSDRYWSAVQQFITSPLVTVALTMLVRRRRRLVNASVSLVSIPDPIMTDPKSMALNTR